MGKCTNCGQEVEDSASYCSNCGEEIARYPKPAGFWIRVVASLVDFLIFIPVVVLSFVNFFSIKSTALLMVIGLPGLIYKPFMESYYGATLGKMVCGLRVVDELGEKLSLGAAYVRFIPFLVSAAISMVGALILFSAPGFQSASTLLEIGELQQRNPTRAFETIVNLFVTADCIVAGFSHRKRALHDMMAGSFCIYKERRFAESSLIL